MYICSGHYGLVWFVIDVHYLIYLFNKNGRRGC